MVGFGVSSIKISGLIISVRVGPFYAESGENKSDLRNTMYLKKNPVYMGCYSTFVLLILGLPFD
jgi:hypothetical protein